MTFLNIKLYCLNARNNNYIHVFFQIGHVKPQLNEQIAVGTWWLLLVTDSQLVAKLNFLVTPLSYWKAKKMDSKKINELIDSPNNVYHVTEEMNRKWSGLVRSAILNEQNAHGQNRIDDDLDDWIDKLVYEHYDIDEICDTGESQAESKLQKCIDTHWSSLSPDSKADIHNLCQNY